MAQMDSALDYTKKCGVWAQASLTPGHAGCEPEVSMNDAPGVSEVEGGGGGGREACLPWKRMRWCDVTLALRCNLLLCLWLT